LSEKPVRHVILKEASVGGKKRVGPGKDKCSSETCKRKGVWKPQQGKKSGCMEDTGKL